MTAYEQGFMDKCAELGVNPAALVKAAQAMASSYSPAAVPPQGVYSPYAGVRPAVKAQSPAPVQGNAFSRFGTGVLRGLSGVGIGALVRRISQRRTQPTTPVMSSNKGV